MNMTANILLEIGVFWFLAIATAADLAATIEVCKHVEKYVANEGLWLLAATFTMVTALAVAAILWISAMSFLLNHRSEKSKSAKVVTPREHTATKHSQRAYKSATSQPYIRIEGEYCEGCTVTVRDDDEKLIAVYSNCSDVMCYNDASPRFMLANDLRIIDCVHYLVWVDDVPIGKSMTTGQSAQDHADVTDESEAKAARR